MQLHDKVAAQPWFVNRKKHLDGTEGNQGNEERNGSDPELEPEIRGRVKPAPKSKLGERFASPFPSFPSGKSNRRFQDECTDTQNARTVSARPPEDSAIGDGTLVKCGKHSPIVVLTYRKATKETKAISDSWRAVAVGSESRLQAAGHSQTG